jgi:hypothetical protein
LFLIEFLFKIVLSESFDPRDIIKSALFNAYSEILDPLIPTRPKFNLSNSLIIPLL